MENLEIEVNHLRNLIENYKKAVQLLKDQRNKYIIMYSILANNDNTRNYQKEAMSYEDMQLDSELNKQNSEKLS